MNPRSFLVSGLVAGLLAGVAAFVVAFTLGEPPVDAAIALEEASGQAAAPTHDEAAHDEAAHESAAVVSRGTQSTWGLATGTLAVGTVLGGLTGLVSAAAMGRLGPLRPAAGTAVVTLLGFVSVALVPFLKYPATPPAVGDPGTIGLRTGSYFGFVALCLLAAVAAVLVTRRLLAPAGGYGAVVAGAATYLLLVGVAAATFPAVDEVGGFPAGLLWDFRVASLLVLATLWGTMGVALTGLVERRWRRHARAVARRELAAAL